MDCLKPNHSKSKALEVFRANLDFSVGSDHRSSEVRRTYIEERNPGFGGVYAGDDVGSMAGPGGYHKIMTSQGSKWSGAITVGGPNSQSYAHAGPNGTYGHAGKGGHAAAMYGDGDNFGAVLCGPGGQVLTRNMDGSTSRHQNNYQERMSYPEKQPGRITYDDEYGGAARYGDERQGGNTYSGKKKKKQKAIGYH